MKSVKEPSDISRRSFLLGAGCAGMDISLPGDLFSDEQITAPMDFYSPKMSLSSNESEILEGSEGPVMQKIMSTVVRLGDLFDATHLAPLDQPIHSVASFALTYFRPMFNIVRELKKNNISTTMPFSCNPGPTDYKNVEVNLPEKGAFRVMFPTQERFIRNLKSIGMKSEGGFSCACYHDEVGVIPNFGDILCWSESSAVSFANSVLGARSNRNSGIFDFFCGVLGKTPYYGLLTDEGRRANFVVNIKSSKKPDPWVLGKILGTDVQDGVPYIKGLDRFLGGDLTPMNKGYFKDMGAAAASYGSIGLYHAEGLTPEAKASGESLIVEGATTIDIDDKMLADRLKELMSETRPSRVRLETCLIGCPHNSLDQLYYWTDLIEKALKTARRSKVAIKTILVAAPETIVKFKEDPKGYRRLAATGAELGGLCALMHAKNPLIGQSGRIISNSSKLSHYGDVIFAPEAAIVKSIVKGAI